MTTERTLMNRPHDILGTMRSSASAVGSPRGTGVSMSNDARGEARTNRAAARFAWLLWMLSVLCIIGYIPLRYQWHAVAFAPTTMLPPYYIAALKITVPKVIEDALVHASYLICSALGALIVSRTREQRIGWIFCVLGLAS